MLLDRFLHTEDMPKDLAFVVRRAARKHIAVLQYRIEWRRVPQLKRVRRLNIVVPVNHDRAAAALMFIFRPDNRVTRCGHELGFEADIRQFLDQPMRALGKLLGVLLVG